MTTTYDEIVEAARRSGADEFITLLPDGYDTEIDEEGSNVSAGERQLITIARAFLADPQLLELFAKMNVTPTPGTPEAFAAYIAEEAQRWKRFVAESGVNLAE